MEFAYRPPTTRSRIPQVDWERAGENAERIVFGTSLAPDGTRIASTVLRLDLETGEARSFTDGHYVFGEPLFVGAPDRQTEGEGVLLAVGSSGRGAALFVLDATTLGVLARAEVSTAPAARLPRHVCSGVGVSWPARNARRSASTATCARSTRAHGGLRHDTAPVPTVLDVQTGLSIRNQFRP